MPGTNDQEVLRRLDILLEQRPELAEAIRFYRHALPALRVAGGAVIPFAYSADAAQRKLDAGIPLLAGENLPFDQGRLLALFGMLCRVVEADDTSEREANEIWPWEAAGEARLAAAAAQIRQAAEDEYLDIEHILAAVAGGDGDQIRRAAQTHGLDPGLLVMLVQNTLKPMLRAWAASLAQDVDLSVWRRGRCPFCGSQPALGELEGFNGPRYLRCGLCSARWPYPSSQCPFCTNAELARLSYFTVESEEEEHYVQGCAACGGYLKTVVTTSPLSPDFLVAEDLATLHLDAIAVEQGYSRNPVPPERGQFELDLDV